MDHLAVILRTMAFMSRQGKYMKLFYLAGGEVMQMLPDWFVTELTDTVSMQIYRDTYGSEYNMMGGVIKPSHTGRPNKNPA